MQAAVKYIGLSFNFLNIESYYITVISKLFFELFSIFNKIEVCIVYKKNRDAFFLENDNAIFKPTKKASNVPTFFFFSSKFHSSQEACGLITK